jgi:hypothetical protein
LHDPSLLNQSWVGMIFKIHKMKKDHTTHSGFA